MGLNQQEFYEEVDKFFGLNGPDRTTDAKKLCEKLKVPKEDIEEIATKLEKERTLMQPLAKKFYDKITLFATHFNIKGTLKNTENIQNMLEQAGETISKANEEVSEFVMNQGPGNINEALDICKKCGIKETERADVARNLLDLKTSISDLMEKENSSEQNLKKLKDHMYKICK